MSSKHLLRAVHMGVGMGGQGPRGVTLLKHSHRSASTSNRFACFVFSTHTLH